MRRHALLVAVMLIGASTPTHAFDPLALVLESTSPQADPLGVRFEAWHQHFDWRDRPRQAASAQQRLVLDVRREWSVAEGTRVGISNRLERLVSASRSETRNALRELYVSHEVGAGWYADAGCINWRNGVANGFNPTDYLRRGTVIEQGTQNPRALRENRLGTVMLRQQWVGEPGSVQLALIPALRQHGSEHPTSPAWARSNPVRAALVKVSPTLGERASAELLAYRRDGDGLQLGGNLTYLVGDALVLYAEGSSGRRAARETDAVRRYRDVAGGASWTTPAGPVLSAEFLHDREAGARAVFVRAAWARAFKWPELDIAGFVRRGLDHRARLWQLDVAWHLDARYSLAVIVGGQRGSAPHPAGASPRRYASFSLSAYF